MLTGIIYAITKCPLLNISPPETGERNRILILLSFSDDPLLVLLPGILTSMFRCCVTLFFRPDFDTLLCLHLSTQRILPVQAEGMLGLYRLSYVGLAYIGLCKLSLPSASDCAVKHNIQRFAICKLTVPL